MAELNLDQFINLSSFACYQCKLEKLVLHNTENTLEQVEINVDINSALQVDLGEASDLKDLVLRGKVTDIELPSFSSLEHLWISGGEDQEKT